MGKVARSEAGVEAAGVEGEVEAAGADGADGGATGGIAGLETEA